MLTRKPKLIRVHVYLDETVIKDLDKLCESTERSRSEVIRIAIQELLDAQS